MLRKVDWLAFHKPKNTKKNYRKVFTAQIKQPKHIQRNLKVNKKMLIRFLCKS